MDKMAEMTGKIVIDDTYYPGRDLYCDGAVEEEILEIVKTKEPSMYGKEIEERKNWPVLYHLSRLRENIVSWIPVKKTDRVLEVGSGCGAVTGALARMAGSVTCIELSERRSQINACRHPDCGNVTIKLGNFQEIEPHLACDYDYIFLIGVFEYAQSYIGGEKPYETFMAILKRHLAPGGRLVIAIENRLGLKYWAGCKEDHLGTYFDGIEGYPRGGGVRTFTRSVLEEICRANGIGEYRFYYPYPDYKFMTSLYSDARLPKVGELSDNMRNFDRERMLLFDEKQVFDSLIREGQFPLFSNSYVLVTGGALPVVYARCSNDRAPQYAIRTEIRRRGDGCFEVRKIPQSECARAHVAAMAENCRRLEEAYAGSGLLVNTCHMDGEEAVFAYLSGRTLEEALDDCLDRDDKEGFQALFDRYRQLAEYPTKSAVCNYDLIFSNIIITAQGWHLIDYEWVWDREVPVREIMARALYCYALGSEKRKEAGLFLLAQIGCQERVFEEVAEWEKKFQKYVTGERMSMTEIREAIDYPVMPVADCHKDYVRARERNRIQIYEDFGTGFSEETSYFLPQRYQEREVLQVKLAGKQGLLAVRIDPALDYCIVRLGSLVVDGQSRTLYDKRVVCSGRPLSADTVVFATDDPGITIREPGSGICLEMEVIRISKEMAESMAGESAGEGGRNGKRHKGMSWFYR